MKMQVDFMGETIEADVIRSPSKRMGYSRQPQRSRGWGFWLLTDTAVYIDRAVTSRALAKKVCIRWEYICEVLDLPLASLEHVSNWHLDTHFWHNCRVINVDKLLTDMGV